MLIVKDNLLLLIMIAILISMFIFAIVIVAKSFGEEEAQKAQRPEKREDVEEKKESALITVLNLINTANEKRIKEELEVIEFLEVEIGDNKHLARVTYNQIIYDCIYGRCSPRSGKLVVFIKVKSVECFDVPKGYDFIKVEAKVSEYLQARANAVVQPYYYG